MLQIDLFEKNQESNRPSFNAFKKRLVSIITSPIFKSCLRKKERFHIDFQIPFNEENKKLAIVFSFEKNLRFTAIIFHEATTSNNGILKTNSAQIVVNCNDFRVQDNKEMFFSIIHEYAHFFVFQCSKNLETRHIFQFKYLPKLVSRGRFFSFFPFKLDPQQKKYQRKEYPICYITREIIFEYRIVLALYKRYGIVKSRLLKLLSNKFFVPESEVENYITSYESDLIQDWVE